MIWGRKKAGSTSAARRPPSCTKAAAGGRDDGRQGTVAEFGAADSLSRRGVV